jgi:hypothetical protein
MTPISGISLLGDVVKLKMPDREKGMKFLQRANISKSNQYPLFPKSKDVEKFPPDLK